MKKKNKSKKKKEKKNKNYQEKVKKIVNERLSGALKKLGDK